jgi:uncharacterized LabA/DUF88 family protein
LSGEESQQQKRGRGAVYIDGFNLYHPIKESNLSHLKWSNQWQLGELLCKAENLDLVKVVFCTALPKHLPDSHDRHVKFNNAQIANGVTVIKGHYVPENGGQRHSEKQSDINVALSLILDGVDNIYDVAFLVSADSDQVATGKFFKERLAPAGKRMFAVIPFTKTYPPDFAGLGVERRKISIDMIEACLMPEQVQGQKGMINRPPEYAPPEGWVHPADRPKGKAPPPPKRNEWSKGFKAPR